MYTVIIRRASSRFPSSIPRSQYIKSSLQIWGCDGSRCLAAAELPLLAKILLKFGSKAPWTKQRDLNLSLNLSLGSGPWLVLKVDCGTRNDWNWHIRMFENSDWKEQRTATTRQEIMRQFALRDEILKDKKRHLSRLTSVFDFFQALPLLLLEVGHDDPNDRPTE